jgi:hypothetical protein
VAAGSAERRSSGRATAGSAERHSSGQAAAESGVETK